MKKPPKMLTDAGLSMFVDSVKLRELPLPIEEIKLEELIWHFDMPVWAKDDTDDWNCTPWEVIRKEKDTTDHQKLIEKCELKYPIILTEYNNRLVVIDGVHRIAKAYMLGHKTIKAKIIPKKYLEMKEYQT